MRLIPAVLSLTTAGKLRKTHLKYDRKHKKAARENINQHPQEPHFRSFYCGAVYNKPADYSMAF